MAATACCQPQSLLTVVTSTTNRCHHYLPSPTTVTINRQNAATAKCWPPTIVDHATVEHHHRRSPHPTDHRSHGWTLLSPPLLSSQTTAVMDDAIIITAVSTVMNVAITTTVMQLLLSPLSPLHLLLLTSYYMVRLEKIYSGMSCCWKSFYCTDVTMVYWLEYHNYTKYDSVTFLKI